MMNSARDVFLVRLRGKEDMKVSAIMQVSLYLATQYQLHLLTHSIIFYNTT
jgi:hypothetical protein